MIVVVPDDSQGEVVGRKLGRSAHLYGRSRSRHYRLIAFRLGAVMEDQGTRFFCTPYRKTGPHHRRTRLINLFFDVA
jgi:hypothetical protein